MTERNSGNLLPYKSDSRTYYNIGLKHAFKKKYLRALKFLVKAVEMEPFNADYQFNLACVHAELNQIEDSNKALMSIIKDIDPTAVECYFGIACNYFDMGDLKKAREYLEKYVSSSTEGEFDDLAYDILYYLEMFEDSEPESKNRKRISRLFALGKSFLEAADYERACSQLEKVIEIDPFELSARNYLALACFLNDDPERAVSLAESVLKVEEYNIFARLNLALFYAHKKMMDKCDEHLAAAAKISHDGTDRFVVFLKNAVKDIDVEPLIKRKIIDVLKPNPSKKECYGIKLVGESSRFEWRKEWKEVIQCAVKNSSSSYLCDYKSEIEQIWMEFIKKACPEKTPIIRKPEVWAAVLEYIYCSANLIRITKAELAQKYKISAASITRKLNAINTWCST